MSLTLTRNSLEPLRRSANRAPRPGAMRAFFHSRMHRTICTTP
ncbi:protein of unknown function [Burkholderia multivorans]